jgi:hypothetical protein
LVFQSFSRVLSFCTGETPVLAVDLLVFGGRRLDIGSDVGSGFEGGNGLDSASDGGNGLIVGRRLDGGNGFDGQCA